MQCELVRGKLQGMSDGPGGELHTDETCGFEDALLVRLQAIDLDVDELANGVGPAVRDVRNSRGQLPASLARANHRAALEILHDRDREERVSARHFLDARRELFWKSSTGKAALEIVRYDGIRPELEVQGRGLFPPSQLRDHPGHAVALRDLRGTARRDHEDGRRFTSCSEHQQEIRRRCIGPLNVLEHEHQRSFGGDNVDGVGELAEHARLARTLDSQRERGKLLVGDEPGHLRDPCRGVPREEVDEMPVASTAAECPECREDR